MVYVQKYSLLIDYIIYLNQIHYNETAISVEIGNIKFALYMYYTVKIPRVQYSAINK